MTRLPRVAFLDRDGVLNAKAPNGGYVTAPGDVALLPGAGRAVRILNDLDVRVVVVTNQRGIALGLMDEDDLARVHETLASALDDAGARLDGILYCPHGRGCCDCRKPEVGMFRRACDEVSGVTLERAVMIGDARTDMEAAARLDIPGVLIAEPDSNTARTVAREVGVAHVAPSLIEAVRWLESAA